MHLLETIAFTTESCHIAQAAGASRIELCDNPNDGGTTPSYGFIKVARKILHIDLFPIIRPRGGDFLYTDDEFNIMKTDVLMCKNAGCNGVVIGILNRDATIDKIRCQILVNIAYPMEVTFHRAFDRVINIAQALTDAIDIGCNRILTSGQYPTAFEGIDTIKKLVSLAGDDIIIMPGSGVRASNIEQITLQTGATEIHSSARKMYESLMLINNTLMNEQLQTTGVDEIEIKEMVLKLKNIIPTS